MAEIKSTGQGSVRESQKSKPGKSGKSRAGQQKKAGTSVPETGGLPYVLLFTDGACQGNPGPGGWAFILRHPKSGKELVASGAEAETTNNRMELTAVVRGLEALKRPSYVELITDSVYVGKGITEWLSRWKSHGWRRKEGKSWAPIKNEDLWRRLDELLSRHKVIFKHIPGHSGHPENERCDALAVSAYKQLMGQLA
jgi:ribonuclease HI